MESVNSIKNLMAMSKTSHYNEWIYSTIEPFLGKRILEIGCGVGTMTQFLLGGRTVVSVDNSATALEIMKGRFFGTENLKLFLYDIIDGDNTELRKHNFDTIVCISVLEHIKNDLKALQNSYDLLEKKGRLIIFVPAIKALYGTIDQEDGHFRRYGHQELKNKLKRANFFIEKYFSMNLFGIIPWFFHNKILKKQVHPEDQMKFLDRFVPFCAFLENTFHPPFGLNLVSICHKDKR